MNNKLLLLKRHKISVTLVVLLVLIIVGSVFGFRKLLGQKTNNTAASAIAADINCTDDLPGETALNFADNGPYGLVLPRRDGNALVLDIKRVSEYDLIYYQLAYVSDGIDRGVCGFVKKPTDTQKKEEYSQEILFGTCSGIDTYSILHCVFDKDVQNGTLTLHIKSGNKAYKLVTDWHLQQPDVALGVVTSADGHFTYKTDASRDDLNLTGYTVVNDLSGAPKIPDGQQIVGKVYALNVPAARAMPPGTVTIELADTPMKEVKIAQYNDSKNKWDLLETAVKGDTVTAPSQGSGIFAVLAPVKSK